MTEFEAALAAHAARLDEVLDGLLKAADDARLDSAMRYAALGGGKRLRPYVLIESARLFRAPEQASLHVACALECVHAYSLVHDDLPAMDDDDLRRGRPTVHRAFDEATAILAGDALLTFAFELLADERAHPQAGVRVKLVHALARAAGAAGMVGGQVRDLAAEGRFKRDGRPVAADETAVLVMQGMKTGALFRFAAEAGALLGEAGAGDLQRMALYGSAVGLAFQVADDLLDEEASVEELGKATAKDRARGKATLVAALGAAAARERLDALLAEARAALAPYGAAAEPLVAAAHFAANRRR